MTATHTTSLFLFRRDLRLHDNLALIAALNASSHVIPCFILDKTLLDKIGNNLPRVKYLASALQELDKELRDNNSQLHVIYSKPVDAINQLQTTYNADAIFFHRDISPYANRRDTAIQEYCKKSGIDCHIIDDITLNAPRETLKADGTPYTVFTPFFRRAFLLPVPTPKRIAFDKLARKLSEKLSISTALRAAGIQVDKDQSPTEQSKTALQHLTNLQDYQFTRDIPAERGTSRLSAALRFGIISSREAWWAISKTLGNEHPLLRQLYWRDFFFSIGLHYPRVFTGCFHQKYNAIIWPNQGERVNAWKTARTGFPIVDAGLRELHLTGYMHNRVRMIVASFLVKDLHCNWQIGERHFAHHLLDYDPSINNGNWQWAASTGCDAQPYFRIFNPWTQQQKFDPDCAYIKRWLPELANIPSKTLHNLYKLDEALQGYVIPIIDHGTQSKIAKQLFEAVRATP